MLPVSFPGQECLARRNDLSCHRTSFSLFQHALPPASRARSGQGCERGSHGTGGDAGRERRVYSASPKSQPLGCRRLPSTPWTKRAESHFSLIRPAAWRKMIASRCTHVLMWKEFQLLCQLYCTMSTQLQGAFQSSLIPCRCWEPVCVGIAELTHRRDNNLGSAGGSEAKGMTSMFPLLQGTQLGFINPHFPGKHPLCLKLHKAVSAKLCLTKAQWFQPPVTDDPGGINKMDINIIKLIYLNMCLRSRNWVWHLYIKSFFFSVGYPGDAANGLRTLQSI